jgi:hypothetical protein
MHILFYLRINSIQLIISTPILVQPTDITRMQYTKCRCVAPSEDEQVMLETCKGT